VQKIYSITSIIQFLAKSVTKYFNFSLMIYINWYSWELHSRRNVWVRTWRAWLTVSYTNMYRAVYIWSYLHHAFLLFLLQDLGQLMMLLIARTTQYPRDFRWKPATLHEVRLSCYLGYCQFPQKTQVPRWFQHPVICKL